MEALIKILEKFDKKRNELVSQGKWNEDAVAECFEPCARGILCNGYFLVNGEYIIDLGAIELYYHEEDGTIKDPKMYHTNDKLPNVFKERLKKYPIEQLPIFYKELKENDGYPYFKRGSFNLHQSGIDVTFENDDNKNDKYRASFLIRSYRMFKKDDPNKDIILYDYCSSHLYDDLYYSGLLSFLGTNAIKWVEYNKGGDIEQGKRINIEGERLWQFRLVGLKTIK